MIVDKQNTNHKIRQARALNKNLYMYKFYHIHIFQSQFTQIL